MAGLPSVPVADDLVKSQLIATEHAAVETINTVSRTLVGGSKGAAGLASGLPVLAEALEALDATIEPGMRFTALYPARIDPHLPPSEPRLACFVVARAPVRESRSHHWRRLAAHMPRRDRRHDPQPAPEREAPP